jgi:hypothetical protein
LGTCAQIWKGAQSISTDYQQDTRGIWVALSGTIKYLQCMKRIHAALKNENHLSMPGLILAFVAGCLTATLFWYFII